METKKLIVPARLLQAAEELKDKTTIKIACSKEVQEVMDIARKCGVLCTWGAFGRKIMYESMGLCETDAFCLPDYIIIEAEPETPTIPEWIEKDYQVCAVTQTEGAKHCINLPDGTCCHTFVLGTPRIKGWQFCGWIHNNSNELQSTPFGYIDGGRNFSRKMHEVSQLEPSTAIATAWKEVK